MANAREIKLRMKSIRDTRQITGAMKLISAAKLRKARQQLEQTMPFFNKVRTTIADILTHSGSVDSIFFDIRNEKEGRKKGYIVFSGDRGLSGGYNPNINKLAESQLKANENSLVMVAGRMGRSYLTKKGYNVDRDFDYPVQNPTVIRAREITEVVIERFLKGELDEVYVIYTKMVSSIKLEPTVLKLLPLEIGALREDLKDVPVKHVDENIVYEPSTQAVLDVLINKYVKGIVYGAFVEAFASEQSAMMTAMDSATSNADDILQRLNLSYNRARQAAITQEISEIVGGAAALQ